MQVERIVKRGDILKRLATSRLLGGGGATGPVVPTPSIEPLTAQQSIYFPSRNGLTQGLRLQAPQLSNWMRLGVARQAGCMMLDVLVQNDANIESTTTRPQRVVAGIGTSSVSGIWTLSYNSSNNSAGSEKRLNLYCRTNEMAGAGDPAMIALGPNIRDGEQGTAFMLFSSTEMTLAMAWADGTVTLGTPVAMPASFVGRASPGVMNFGGAQTTLFNAITLHFSGSLSRFAYLRGRVPTEAEMVRVARGESPDAVFTGELDRYYPMNGPTDLTPDVGSGDLTLVSVGTDVGYVLRNGGTLAGASNGTVGFTVSMPLSGHVWAIDFDDVAAGAPVELEVTNTLGVATQFEARAVLYSDRETNHKPWTQMSGGPVAGGATATLTLPSVAWSELLHVEVRRSDTTGVTWCSGPCGVGPDIIDDGQSQRQIWASNLSTDTTVLAGLSIPNPCVTIAYTTNTTGPVMPLIHRLIDTAINTPIGPAAFAKRFAELTGNKVARIRTQSVEGSGRNQYTANNQLPKTVNTGPYRFWGTLGSEGTGIVADHLLKCGNRFSAIVGHYSADDLESTVFADNANPYFLGTGSPSRHWGQVANPLGLRVFLCLHDRIFRNSLAQTPIIVGGFYSQIRDYVAANSSICSLAPAFTLDKRMDIAADQAHQDADHLTGNARMSYRYATWLAGLMNVTGGLVEPGTLTAVTSVSPFTSATCSFSIPIGASLLVSDAGMAVIGFETNINGGGWNRVVPANATISGNTVVISGITGASAASEIQVRYGYDHAWGDSADPATRFDQDNLLIEQVLLTSVPNAPAEPTWAKGMPLNPSNGLVVAT